MATANRPLAAVLQAAASGRVKCRWCRGLFERPAALPADVPATTCRSLECRARQREHVRELDARRASA